jgi:hypothetical protein
LVKVAARRESMQIKRLLIVAVALAAAVALTVLTMLGAGGPLGRRSGATPLAHDPDPAAGGRGALLLNPYCRNVPAPGFDRPPNVARTGQFNDASYGYAVAIPAGVTAYASPELPTQGFGILLSWDPRAYLRVDASYDVFYDINADAVHRRDMLGVRLHDTLLADRSVPDGLAGAGGGRYRMQFQCPGDAQVYIRDDLIVVRNREVYRLELQTVPSRYAADAQLLAAMQSSWRWLPVPHVVGGGRAQ